MQTISNTLPFFRWLRRQLPNAPATVVLDPRLTLRPRSIRHNVGHYWWFNDVGSCQFDSWFDSWFDKHVASDQAGAISIDTTPVAAVVTPVT